MIVIVMLIQMTKKKGKSALTNGALAALDVRITA